jgi:hypothetical protein
VASKSTKACLGIRILRPMRIAPNYAYVLDPDRLTVLLNRDGWQPVAEPAWADTPDWDAIDHHAQQLRRWGPP